MADTLLAQRLRELRNTMTQQEIGVALGVSPALVSSWENALAVPPHQRLLAYASLFAPETTDVLLEELILLSAPTDEPFIDDEDTIAMFRLPMPSRRLIDLIEALCRIYEDELEVQTRDGWLTFAKTAQPLA